MSKLFVRNQDGRISELSTLPCKDEGKELQFALEQDHDLLPGDQISPDDPSRWLLIKREMPVQDPKTGVDRWSIDFAFIDQNAVLTLVECKRYKDTRSRREVVGQVFEYAANAQRYWDAQTLRVYASDTAEARGTTIECELKSLKPSPNVDSSTPDAFFECAAQKLQAGLMRIIFYLDEAPDELKSIVEFLKKQMERAQILLVEACQYRHGNDTIIVPRLFGYEDKFRASRQSVENMLAPARSPWDEMRFFSVVGEQLGPAQQAAMREMYEYAKSAASKVTWGSGLYRGTFNAKYDDICPRSLFSVASDGTLSLNFANFYGSDEVDKLRSIYLSAARASGLFELDAEAADKFPTFGVDTWMGKLPQIKVFFDDVCRSMREAVAQAKIL